MSWKQFSKQLDRLVAGDGMSNVPRGNGRSIGGNKQHTHQRMNGVGSVVKTCRCCVDLGHIAANYMQEQEHTQHTADNSVRHSEGTGMSMLWPQRALEERLSLEGCRLPRLWKAWALGAGLQDCTDSSSAEAGRCSCKVLCRNHGTTLPVRRWQCWGLKCSTWMCDDALKKCTACKKPGLEVVEPTVDTAKKKDHSRLHQPKAMDEVCGRLLGGPGDADGDASMIAEDPLPQVVVQHNFGGAKVDNANCTGGGDEGTSGGSQGHEGEVVQDSEGRS